MAELTRDVATYCVSLGLVTGIGEDIFLDFLPASPDDVVSVNEYAGPTPPRGIKTLDRNIQIRIRSQNYALARQRAWAFFNALDNPEDPILNYTADRWSVTWAKQTPASIGRDESGRSEFTFNLGITTYRDE